MTSLLVLVLGLCVSTAIPLATRNNPPPKRKSAYDAVLPRGAVLDNVTDEIRECYEHAEKCKRLAGAQSDAAARMDYLNLAGGWLVLARSYEFTERLTRFTFKPPR